MSSILETGNNKNKCQKFTPDTLVKTMLDLANYNSNLIGKTILENSFGTGNILKEIVIRYIKSGIESNIDKADISDGLAHDIYGIELDKELYKRCILDLNEILSSYAIPAVDWKLYNNNALSLNLELSFDFIIGNPPYISYKEIDERSQKELKEKYESCSIGKFDYCYAFIELGVKKLKNTGKLVQLIPNNIYKNVYAQKLREILQDHISIIYDYPNQKLFDKTLTSISIFLYDKQNNSDNVHYKNITDKTSIKIARQSLGQKWMFCKSNNHCRQMIRFGDVFNASVTVATLCNNAFIVDEKCIKEEKLEMGALREAVSPKTLRYNKKKSIIFPYLYHNGALQRYPEKVFEQRFPNTVKHLKLYFDKLSARNSDKNATWFEYGRSQALSHLNKEKLLVSTIITNKVEVYKLGTDTIPYSGIYITVVDSRYTLEDAEKILQSELFLEYIKGIGINICGKSIRITCKDINNYLFSGGQ